MLFSQDKRIHQKQKPLGLGERFGALRNDRGDIVNSDLYICLFFLHYMGPHVLSDPREEQHRIRTQLHFHWGGFSFTFGTTAVTAIPGVYPIHLKCSIYAGCIFVVNPP